MEKSVDVFQEGIFEKFLGRSLGGIPVRILGGILGRIFGRNIYKIIRDFFL